MNKKVCCALVAVAFAVAGCAGSAYDVAKKHEALRNYDGADAGVVIASAGSFKGSGFTSSSVTFRRRGTEDLLSFSYSPKQDWYPGKDVPDFETSMTSGVVFVKRLPPGEYEFQSTDGYKLHGGNGYHCWKPVPSVATFTVSPGEVIYLGRYVTTSSTKTCVTLYISNEQETDMSVAKARSPIPVNEVHSYAPAAEQRL
ncbi:hypothetical protein GM658_16330 [Pseudoduganella eburnea]|uniref:DUF2846 domain-containing protein n=1 Tax=Massilia eburnea TaxID=1776165 RepID=A0A6L6QKQ0_9BURK|nr:hypothetical protein [Massilia eburnea]MTW12173.1 hypothetical protein [Massilia eburnea]